MPGRSKGQFQGTILVADDHEVFRIGLIQTLRRSLKAKNFLQAESYAQVLDHLQDASLRLILLDLQMPGLASARAISHVRELSPDAQVVVLSGYDERQHIIEALEAGAHGYIVKNQNRDRLVDRLRYILSGEIYVPPSLAELRSAPAEHVVNARGAAPIPPKALSSRQRQVLKGVVEGKSNKEIARTLNVAEGTIKIHLTALFRVLGANNRAHAVALGRQLIG